MRFQNNSTHLPSDMMSMWPSWANHSSPSLIGLRNPQYDWLKLMWVQFGVDTELLLWAWEWKQRAWNHPSNRLWSGQKGTEELEPILRNYDNWQREKGDFELYFWHHSFMFLCVNYFMIFQLVILSYSFDGLYWITISSWLIQVFMTLRITMYAVYSKWNRDLEIRPKSAKAI